MRGPQGQGQPGRYSKAGLKEERRIRKGRRGRRETKRETEKKGEKDRRASEKAQTDTYFNVFIYMQIKNYTTYFYYC